MSRLRSGKTGSLLALLAILMSVLAPAISQTLAAHHRLGDGLSAFCTAQAASDARSQGTPDHSPGQHLTACAYCNLLAHVPVLPGAATQFAAVVDHTRASTAPSAREVRTLVVHTAAQPRAPPVFS